uniref:Uncharacterized protein n=1 Tax=Photinus pyralis TaxID=7054 RepID=A0A1Y1LXE5_PHOPY
MTTWGHNTLAFLAATKSASSVPFHFIKNISSPVVSDAPIIFSASNPRSNPVLESDLELLDFDFLSVLVSLLPLSLLRLGFSLSSDLSELSETARFRFDFESDFDFSFFLGETSLTSESELSDAARFFLSGLLFLFSFSPSLSDSEPFLSSFFLSDLDLASVSECDLAESDDSVRLTFFADLSSFFLDFFTSLSDFSEDEERVRFLDSFFFASDTLDFSESVDTRRDFLSLFFSFSLSFSFFLSLFVSEASDATEEVELRRFLSLSLLAFFFSRLVFSKASIRSGQSRLSSGSQVLSVSE